MSLSSTMWTSVSGLLGHGKKMNTIGNNIANLNTVGFKGQRMDFSDFVYQNTNSLAGSTQSGFGVQVGAIMSNFGQGTFESSTESTDLAINGSGFFQVQQVGSDQEYYTRAGNFRFDTDGYLVDPNGFALQGWEVDNTGGVEQASGGSVSLGDEAETTSAIIGSGVPTDIKLDTFTIFPQQTTNMGFRVNLPQSGSDKAQSTENPFGALFSIWNGEQPPVTPETPAIAQSSYNNQTTMEVYDEAGTKHAITVYFDKVDAEDYTGGESGDEIWEYIVTMDPANDKRQFADAAGNLINVNSTAAGGLLMSGTLTFDSGGSLTNQTAYTWGGDDTPELNPGSYTPVDDPAGGIIQKQVLNLDPTDMNNWTPAPVSKNGYPIMVPNFSGIIDAQSPGTEAGAKYNVEVNFGLRNSNLSQPWQSDNSLADLNAASQYTRNPLQTGPEYLELKELGSNPGEYDPSLDNNDTKWIVSADRYVLADPTKSLDPVAQTLFESMQLGANPLTYKDTNGVDVNLIADPLDPATNVSDYANALTLYDLDEVFIPANTFDFDADGTTDQPAFDVKVNLLTGEITHADGSPVTGTEVPALDANFITNAEVVDHIASELNAEMLLATVKDYSIYASATPSSANNLAEMTEPAVVEALASTSLDAPFTAANRQDGYTYGDLTSWEFDQNGVLYGMYSNGVELPLWQVTMYDFVSPQGLRREGNNLFSQTRDSGEPKSGAAGTSGLGSVTGYALEQSNVDMSTEFVYMIATQRGFQANSKSITTVDQMLETVIGMKR